MKRRALLVPLLVAAHLAVFVVAMRPLYASLQPVAAAMTVVQIASPAALIAAPPETFMQPVAVAVEAPTFDSAKPDNPAPELPTLVAVGPPQPGCELTETIQSALQASSATAATLSRIPLASRSVANALMVWDGRWAGRERAALDLVPIQQVVVASIRAASEDCRDAAMTGPRLVFIPDGKGSAVLAFGSGVWSWAQLLG